MIRRVLRPVASVSAFCQRHPARAAFARCPGCGVLVCQECATPVAGIIHCPACLTRRASPTTEPRHRGLILQGAVLLAAAWLLTHLAPWALSVVGRWGR